jgi:hypothetical protein
MHAERGLPGLARKGLGDREQSREAPWCLFRGWQANPIQSSVKAKLLQ